MIEVVWEYIVNEDERGLFELAFGPGGSWSRIFSGSPGFKGAALLRETRIPTKFLMIEIWQSADQREKALEARRDELSDLENTFREWIESVREVGVYRLLSEASVRSRVKPRRTHRP